MRHYATSRTLVCICAIGFIGLACSELPTDPPGEPEISQFAKGGGKGGNQPERIPLRITFRDGTDDKISSDSRLDPATYVHGECGVRADFPPSGSGDATFDADLSRIKKNEDARCAGRDPRFIVLELDDPVDGTPVGPTLSEGAFMNVIDLQSVTATGFRRAVFHTSFCSLRYFPTLGGNQLLVTRLGANTWTAETQAFPNDVAYCLDGERGFHVPFKITVSLK